MTAWWCGLRLTFFFFAASMFYADGTLWFSGLFSGLAFVQIYAFIVMYLKRTTA
jgi:hypothetical protein